MQEFKQPLAVYFVWHPSDEKVVKPLVEYCFERYQRDTSKPFSRSMNLPVFFRTSINNDVPIKINSFAEKTMIFCFSSVYVTGYKEWRDYYDTLFDGEGHQVVPIAVDKNGFNLSHSYEGINCIRLSDFDRNFVKPAFFITATHEIIRFAFRAGGTVVGKDSALNLFLSHTKYDDWAVETTVALKKFIDDTSMSRFFDVHDIHVAHKFENEIEKGVLESALIAVQSDSYSTRYWCQKEIQIAKENKIPIIVVNHLKENEDRIFPHTVNVPSVRVESNNAISSEEKYRVLVGALLETLRHYYHTLLLENYTAADVLILSRPPELTDVPLLLSNSGGNIEKNINTILYPEPSVYKDELKFLKPLGITAETPLTMGSSSLKGKGVGISISDPSEVETLLIGHTSKHLEHLSQTLARHLLYRDAKLVYGGDLRPENNFTGYLCEEAKIVQDRLQDTNVLLTNYFSWPIYTNLDESVVEWCSDNHKVAEMEHIDPPAQVAEKHDIRTFLRPDTPVNCFAWSLSLTKMRNEMIQQCDYRVAAGGRLFGYKGKYPGVLEEISIAIKKKKPLYLLGGFGGVTSKVCELLIDGTVPEELTLEWQKNHTSGYSELVELFENDGEEDNVDYKAVVNDISLYGVKSLSENNGLTEMQNRRLFVSEYVEEVVVLILEGINNLNVK